MHAGSSAVLAAAMVMNVEVEVVSATSVRVSWDSVDLPVVTGYIVYYSQAGINDNEETVTTCAIPNPVTIYGLVSDTIYLFQVAATADAEGGGVLVGERSAAVTVRLAITEPPYGLPRGRHTKGWHVYWN